jgi:hypothetical protein
MHTDWIRSLRIKEFDQLDDNTTKRLAYMVIISIID